MLKVARLQSEFWPEILFLSYEFLMKNAPKSSPIFLSLCLVGPTRYPQNSLRKIKIHRRASARAQAEKFLSLRFCRADFGVNFYIGPANVRKIASEFSQRILITIFSANVSALFFQDFRPPKKFTPRESLSSFISRTLIYFTPIFLLSGEIKN